MIVLDGVYSFDGDSACFHDVEAPTSADMQSLLERIIRRIVAQLERDGVLIQDTEQRYLDLTQSDVQDTFNAASVRYRMRSNRPRTRTRSKAWAKTCCRATFTST